MPVASLGMYDGGAVGEANDLLWALLADRLREKGMGDVPARLDRERPLDAIWSDPDLLLAQCCGYPLATRYRGRLRYVATPRYAAPGCIGASYGSRIVVRVDDPADSLAALRGRRAAINERFSNTGMNLFRSAVAPLARGLPFFAEVIETGAHRDSARAVAEERADVAAIDAVTFAHMARADPTFTSRLRTIGWTEAGPGLPFVTSIATSDRVLKSLRDALEQVVRDPASGPVRDVMLLRGVECLPPDAYDRLLAIEDEAARRRYRELA